MTEEKRGISNSGIVQILLHFHLGHFYVMECHVPLLTSQLLDFVSKGEPHVRRLWDSPHFLGDDEDALFDGARSI